MSFPRYPSYKDSGVEWLGEVPAHWEMKRLTGMFHPWAIFVARPLLGADLAFR